jgi:hypothetical protein
VQVRSYPRKRSGFYYMALHQIEATPPSKSEFHLVGLRLRYDLELLRLLIEHNHPIRLSHVSPGIPKNRHENQVARHPISLTTAHLRQISRFAWKLHRRLVDLSIIHIDKHRGLAPGPTTERGHDEVTGEVRLLPYRPCHSNQLN